MATSNPTSYDGYAACYVSGPMEISPKEGRL